MSLGWLIAIAVGCSSLSCFSTAQYDKANGQRIAQIDASYDARDKSIDARYETLLDSVDELKKYLIPIKENSSYSPLNRLDTRADMVACDSRCKSEYASIDGEIGAKFLNDCLSQICRKNYIEAIFATYYEANTDWVVTQMELSTGADVEALFAFSHNQKILSKVSEHLERIQADWSEERRQAKNERQEAFQASWQQHAHEVAEGRAQHRARALAIAAALSTLGNSRNTASSSTGSVYASTSNSCASDFECGMGFQCVKPTYSSSGTCMKSVNSYGNQTFDLPRLDSIGPNMSVGCKAKFDCPIGFSCDMTSGACIR